jgi:hypothetical protein
LKVQLALEMGAPAKKRGQLSDRYRGIHERGC